MTTVAQALADAITHTSGVDTSVSAAAASTDNTNPNSGFEANFGTVPGYVEANEGK